MIFLVYYAIGLIVGIIMVFLSKSPQNIHTISHILLQYQLGVTISLFGLLSAYGHIFMSDRVSKSIGWPTGSKFQIELGYCCLGMGLMGLGSFWYRDGFWLATIIFVSCFLLGAALVHIKEMIHKKNFNPGNSISTLPDILIPLTLVILWMLA